MSLELLNTLAGITTTIVIAATAIAAVVQLRHLRAGNQIAGQLALRQVLLGDDFITAMGRVRFEIPALLEHPAFLKFVREFHVRAPADGLEAYDDVYGAVLLVGRNLENIGNMIRNGLTEKRAFLEQYASLVVLAWDAQLLRSSGPLAPSGARYNGVRPPFQAEAPRRGRSYLRR